MRLFAVIPAHDEALTIREVVTATIPHVEGVIVIDDGSTDGGCEALADLPVKVIRHAENRGKGPRLVEGIARARDAGATHVLTLDADGQHDPADIPAFRAAALAHPGAMILGDRSADMARMPRGRARSIRFGNAFIGWACDRRITDAQCGMRIYPARFLEWVHIPLAARQGFVFETAALLHGAEAGLAFAPIPISARYEGFQQRPSHFRPIADFLAITGSVTGFLLRRGARPRGLLRALGLFEDR